MPHPSSEPATTKHASLNSDAITPPTLNPRPHMALDEPCWCLSNKPWGECHKEREQATRPSLGAVIHDVERIKVPCACAHPDAPRGCDKIAQAHTIQRRGGLTELAENGHVGHISLVDGQTSEKVVGIRSASTFMGFCRAHDAAMFAPIETVSPNLDTESLFLFSFRALAYAHFMTTNALMNVTILRELDAGLPLEAQALYQQHCIIPKMIGTERTMKELSALKGRYDAAYRTPSYADFHSCAWVFSDVLPVAYAGVFRPEADIHGAPLQRLTHGHDRNEILSACMTPLHGKTLFTLGWFGRSDGPSGRFADAFGSLSDAQKANAAMHLGFEELANVFYQLAWWRRLPADAHDILKAKRLAGTETGPDKQPGSLANASPVLSTATVLNARWSMPPSPLPGNAVNPAT